VSGFDTAAERLCPDCGLVKPAGEFRRNRARPDGLAHYCTDCFKVRDARTYRRRRAAEGRTVRTRQTQIDGKKRCPACDRVLGVESFNLNKAQSSGRGTYCKDCIAVRSRRGRLRRIYGLTEEMLADMVTAQNGTCAVCRTGRPEHIDHDHVTGKVRGILCLNCNQGLGQFKDSITRFEQAIDYLRDTGTWQKQQVTSGVFRLSSPRPASRPSATSFPLQRLISHRDALRAQQVE
jgi:hypothetical protein